MPIAAPGTVGGKARTPYRAWNNLKHTVAVEIPRRLNHATAVQRRTAALHYRRRYGRKIV